jgi:hypothetical protein
MGIFPPRLCRGTVRLRADAIEPTGRPSKRNRETQTMTDDRSPTVPPGQPFTPDDEPIGGPSGAPAPGMRDALAAWTDLDLTSKLIIAGSVAAILITLVGLPFGAWDSTDFVLMVLTAGIVAGLAAGLRTGPILATQLSLLELGAGAVLGVLSVWNLIEILFDLDQDTRGGALGILLTIGLAIAGVAVLVGAVRRNGGLRALLPTNDPWSLITLAGLVVVLAYWTLNISVGYWTMAAAAFSLGTLTLAAVIVVVSRRIESPIPAAWAGVVLGALAALLTIGQWGALMDLGRRIALSPVDLLGFLVYVGGIAAITVGAVMTALDQSAEAVTGEVASIS